MNKKMQGEPALVCSEIGLVRCLGTEGIPVLTGAEKTGTGAFYSRYSKMQVLFSSYESEEFIEELIQLGQKLDYKPVLMSYDDRLIMNISRHREVLEKYYHFLLPEEEMVENLLDKVKFISLSDQYNLPSPASIRVSEPAHLAEAVEKLQKPYLIKPLYRHHWFHQDFKKTVGTYKKAFVCSSATELEERYRDIAQINPHVVVQEYIPGTDSQMYDVNMYVDRNGSIKGCVVAQKLRVYPPTAGYGSYVITVDAPEILSLSKQIVTSLQLCGLINVQFKKDERTGEPKLIEIHTRTSIFDVLGIKSGVNVPALYYADMTGKATMKNGNSKPGVKYIHMTRDLRFILKNRDELTLPNLVKSYRGPKVIDGFSVLDPLPTVVEFWWMIKNMAGVFGKKSRNGVKSSAHS